MSTSKQIVGELIKISRIKRGLTQQDLADELNTDRQYISKLEAGKINLTMDYLDKVLKKIKCSHKTIFRID
jgi:transcriptional regulator with XRE-family HTH domain